MIATDGVFSMDGYIAKLPEICDLAEKYDTLVMVDDSHAVGFMGKNGRGTPEYHNVVDRIDVITGTLGKALGGASGGYTSGRKEIVDLLRQRSRPYLFSNSVAPPIVGSSIAAIELLESSTELRDKLMDNTQYFRDEDRRHRPGGFARRASDRSGHVRRRASRRKDGRITAAKRRVCYSVLLPRSAKRQGEDQNAGFSGPFKRRSRFCGREICRGQS